MNLLKEKYPEIFSQINIEKTLEKYPNLDIDNLTCGSRLKIFWNCPHSHLYSSAIYHRTKDHSGCPYCCNLKLWPGYNDLETFCNHNIEYKYLLDEWDAEKNNLKANEVLAGGTKKYYWKCPNGHEYLCNMHHRIVSKSGCPYCTNQKILPGYNDLETWIKNHTDYQFILDEWDYSKNKISINKIGYQSHQYAWFRCPNGHEYKAKIYNKTIKKPENCPYCSSKKLLPGFNDLETFCINHQDFQYILDTWDYDKNTKKPNEVMPGCNKKYWFKCGHNHTYLQQINNKVRYMTGCPYCSNNHSTPELTIFEIIKKYADPLVLSGYKIDGWEIDVYSPKYNLCLEYDGIFFHSSDNAKDREQRKNKIILENSYGYKLIRIKETDDASEINSFKYVDNGVLIYYISKDYDNKYFQILSKIIEDIFGIIVDYKDIFNYFTKIKLNKLISSEG